MSSSHAGHPRRWMVLGVLMISLLVVVLDNTVLNVALRTIADPQEGLGASQGELEWAVNSYTLTFAGLLFTWGVLADRAGRRRVLLIGIALFGLASLASAYARDPGELIAARAVMGVGGAAVLPTTLSIISDVFDERERARAIGMWAGVVGLATALGPIVGGWLLEHVWWGSVFLINVPIVAVGMIAIVLCVPESRDPHPGRIDVIGVPLSIVGLVALVYGIVDGGEHGFDRWESIVPMVAGLAVLAIFIAYERRAAFPSMDVTLFRSARFSTAVGLLGLVFFVAMGAMFFVSFYLQTVRGYSPMKAGAVFLPFAIAQLIFAPRSAAVVRRFGARIVCAMGMFLISVAMVGMFLIDAETPIWFVCAIFFLQGAGMAHVMPPATEAALSAVPRHKVGVGSAIANTIRQIGGALGVAVLGSVVSSLYRDELAPNIARLPEKAWNTANESVAGAHAVAERLGPAGKIMAHHADEAFVTAMGVASLVAIGVAVMGILAALIWMPSRTIKSQDEEAKMSEDVSSQSNGAKLVDA